MNNRIGVLGIILENPEGIQNGFNTVVSDHKHLIKGRLGIPFREEGISVISLVVVGTMDEINSFTGKLGNIQGLTVKTSISKKEI